MADNDDVKEKMRQALEAKKRKSSSGGAHGNSTAQEKGHEHSDRAGGKREFRRKSG